MKNRANTYLTVIAVGLLFGVLDTSADARIIRDGSQPIRWYGSNSSQLQIPVTPIDAGLLLDVGLYDGDSGGH